MRKYLLFAFNEAFILRSSSSKRVWRTLLLGASRVQPCADRPGMLIADFGHLGSMLPLGLGVFAPSQWGNPLVAGSIPFVIAGASMRIVFLLTQ